MRSGSTPPTSAMTSLIRLVVPSSTPFIRRDQRRRRRGSSGAHAAEVGAQRLGGHGEHDEVGAVGASAGSAVARNAGGSAMPGR